MSEVSLGLSRKQRGYASRAPPPDQSGFAIFIWFLCLFFTVSIDERYREFFSDRRQCPRAETHPPPILSGENR